MSHIPSSAMPHAGPSHQSQQDSSGGDQSGQKNAPASSRAGKIAQKARGNPKTAIAAGAVVAAGVIAAAAIPLVRSRKKNAAESGSGEAQGSPAKAKKTRSAEPDSAAS